MLLACQKDIIICSNTLIAWLVSETWRRVDIGVKTGLTLEIDLSTNFRKIAFELQEFNETLLDYVLFLPIFVRNFSFFSYMYIGNKMRLAKIYVKCGNVYNYYILNVSSKA